MKKQKQLQRIARRILPALLAIAILAMVSPAALGQGRDWASVDPVSIDGISDETVVFQGENEFLVEPGINRRDPSDVIRHEGKYYLWYTKVHEGELGYPGGWKGTVWYATSTDGVNWTERGQAVDKGGEGEWDSAGTYTPNIVKWGGKFYLAYTAMKAPLVRELSRGSIGIAVSGSPDGPWRKLGNNPVIAPGESLDEPDGFLVDDTVFVLRDGKVWLYYKGYPAKMSEGKRVRARRNFFLLVATAESPEGPFTKVDRILHRGHEAMVWKDKTGVGSMGMAFGPKYYFVSDDGIHFKAVHKLESLKAAGVYRTDLEEGAPGARPEWGVAMGENHGLRRYRIVWPEE